MRRFHLLSVFVAVSSLTPLYGCAADTNDDEASQTESEVKKKIKPTGGNGAFDLLKPTWATTGAVGQYRFANRDIAIDSRTELVPGAYPLQTAQLSFAGGQTMVQRASDIVIKAGNVQAVTTTGLRVRYDSPISLGAARVDLVPVSGGFSGALYGNGAWSRANDGALLLVLPGKISTRYAGDSASADLDLIEGKLNEIVLPSAKVTVQLDAYDPAYPTPVNCAAPTLTAGVPETIEAIDVRSGATPVPAKVVPAGTRAITGINAYGIIKNAPATRGQTTSWVLNRLEVDDVEVAAAAGGTTFVKGSYVVEYKDGAGNYRAVSCPSFPTHTGIDLPDGTYRVTSRAQTASGSVTHVEEVSFP